MKFSIKDFFSKCDQIQRKLHYLFMHLQYYLFNLSIFNRTKISIYPHETQFHLFLNINRQLPQALSHPALWTNTSNRKLLQQYPCLSIPHFLGSLCNFSTHLIASPYLSKSLKHTIRSTLPTLIFFPNLRLHFIQGLFSLLKPS